MIDGFIMKQRVSSSWEGTAVDYYQEARDMKAVGYGVFPFAINNQFRKNVATARSGVSGKQNHSENLYIKCVDGLDTVNMGSPITDFGITDGGYYANENHIYEHINFTITFVIEGGHDANDERNYVNSIFGVKYPMTFYFYKNNSPIKNPTEVYCLKNCRTTKISSLIFENMTEVNVTIESENSYYMGFFFSGNNLNYYANSTVTDLTSLTNYTINTTPPRDAYEMYYSIELTTDRSSLSGGQGGWDFKIYSKNLQTGSWDTILTPTQWDHSMFGTASGYITTIFSNEHGDSRLTIDKHSTSVHADALARSYYNNKAVYDKENLKILDEDKSFTQTLGVRIGPGTGSSNPIKFNSLYFAVVYKFHTI